MDEIKHFLEDRGCCTNEAIAVSSALDKIASVHIRSMKQTTLHDFGINLEPIEPMNFLPCILLCFHSSYLYMQ